MKPHNATIDAALFRIFRDVFVSAGGRLSMTTLCTEWSSLHLRREDLSDSLNRLERDECLAVGTHDGHLEVTLLDKGAERISEVPSGFGIFRQGRASIELAMVDRRQSSTEHNSNRRSTDSSAA